VAPWLVGIGFLLLLASLLAPRFSRIRSWFETPALLLLCAGILAQPIDAIRTGQLRARFPNKFPIDVDRDERPFAFWVLTSMFLLLGLFFVAVCVLILIS
jgi:hypothetical protein